MASRAPVANFPVFVDRFARKTGCVRFCRTSSLEQPLTLFDTTNRPGSVSGVEPFLPLIASVDKGVRSRANVSKKKNNNNDQTPAPHGCSALLEWKQYFGEHRAEQPCSC